MTIHLERIAGTTYCPKCGELHRHTVRSVHDGGYPRTVECCGCHVVWEWPSRAEFARRVREHNRERSAKQAERYRTDEAYAERERAKARDRYARNRETICARKRARYQPKVRTCAWCGERFSAKGDSPWCCDGCRRAARKAYGGLVATIASVRRTMERMGDVE